MTRVLGFVIVRDDSNPLELFIGWKHPGTRKVGSPAWTAHLSKCAIYDDVKDAADVALHVFNRDEIHCTARSVWIDT